MPLIRGSTRLTIVRYRKRNRITDRRAIHIFHLQQQSRVIGIRAIEQNHVFRQRFGNGQTAGVVIHRSEICLLDLDVPLHVWSVTRRITFYTGSRRMPGLTLQLMICMFRIVLRRIQGVRFGNGPVRRFRSVDQITVLFRSVINLATVLVVLAASSNHHASRIVGE